MRDFISILNGIGKCECQWGKLTKERKKKRKRKCERKPVGEEKSPRVKLC